MKILIFGTVYCNTEEKRTLAHQWGILHRVLNPGCDLLLVDSRSPLVINEIPVLQLGNNIGHLARCGEDGWGRAFCAGLRYAIDNEYDYVVHIEGDSLFRLPVTIFCEQMQDENLRSLACTVNGTKIEEFAWVETGIMFFSVPYIRDKEFIGRYAWRDGKSKRYPRTPEAVICTMLGEDGARSIAEIRTMRDDKGILTVDNVLQYDWISHTTPEVYDVFLVNSMTKVPA